MITDRPYRRGMGVDAALAELRRHVGTHFWEPVVDAAWALYGPGGTGIALHGHDDPPARVHTKPASSPSAATPASALFPSPPNVQGKVSR
jgi:HD-GYP domain-containing protein (c-di-GMP phosphodiesterase class II)